jgi:hypothetical protein
VSSFPMRCVITWAGWIGFGKPSCIMALDVTISVLAIVRWTSVLERLARFCGSSC